MKIKINYIYIYILGNVLIDEETKGRGGMRLHEGNGVANER